MAFGYWAQKLLTKELQGLDSVFLFKRNSGLSSSQIKTKAEETRSPSRLRQQKKTDCSRSLIAVSPFPPSPNLRHFLPLVKNIIMSSALKKTVLFTELGNSPPSVLSIHEFSVNFKNCCCLLRSWWDVNNFLVILSRILKSWKAAEGCGGREGAGKLKLVHWEAKINP